MDSGAVHVAHFAGLTVAALRLTSVERLFMRITGLNDVENRTGARVSHNFHTLRTSD